jgi:hypothetical protein
VAGIVVIVALGAYAALGEGPAYKVLAAYGVKPPPELRADDKPATKELPDGVDKDHLGEPGEPDT